MKSYKGKCKVYMSLILSCILVCGNVATAGAANLPSYGQYMSGENGQGIPELESEYTMITIATEADLVLLAEKCQVDSWSRDKHVKLANDIVLQENKEIVISSFAGIFDGCGYKISGLEINAAGSALGLFRYVQSSGIVRNLSVWGRVAPGGSKSRIGMIAGVNYGKIIDCNVSGSVTGADEIGGIAGVNESIGEIRRCKSIATVIGDHDIGGICGTNKGTLNHCENAGSINTYSLDVTYSFEDITMENLEDLNSTENVAAHMDTGGIAGYSQGKIYYCSNTGTVGYQHVGYNIGGIVGRLHQGYLQNCTNAGHVLGRKDVGGIAGQMEPFLEVQYLNDKLSEIDRETEVFFDLLEAVHEDLSRYSGEAVDLTRQISENLTNASRAAGDLTGAAIDLWYIYNQELTGINDDLNRLNQEWKDQAEIDKNNNQDNGNQGSNDQGNGSQDNGNQGSNDQGNGSQGDNKQGSNDQRSGSQGDNNQGNTLPELLSQLVPPVESSDQEGATVGNVSLEDNNMNLPEQGDSAVKSAGSGAGEAESVDSGNSEENQPGFDSGGLNLPVLGDIVQNGNDQSGNTTDNKNPDNSDRPLFSVNGKEVVLPDKPWEDNQSWGIQVDLESYFAALRRFGEGTSNHLSNITNATNDRSGGIRENLDTLNRELEAAGNHMQQLSNVLSEGTDKTTANIDALLEQAKVLRRSINELRDDLFRYEGISVEDVSDEEASEEAGAQDDNPGVFTEEEEVYYDTAAFQQGKITLCVNSGLVEADTNVGGIVGQVATEFDFDPEDDIAFTGEESFHIEQTVKAIVRESRNLGEIKGKKDYVGGIIGKADFGAVISCESYGEVSSTGGSYVGGIAGASGYCVRSCYFMGALSGKNNVGGIVGKGCDIFYSYAYPEIEFSGEYAGSIAGQLENDGILYGNYYVQRDDRYITNAVSEADSSTTSEAGAGMIAEVNVSAASEANASTASEANASTALAVRTLPGVDSIGYAGGAEPLAYEEFCRMPGVPKAFSEFTVSLRADGQELASFQCHYGDAIDRTLIPEIPEKEGFYGIWPAFDWDYITGNKVLEVQYEKWITSLASEEKSENGKTRVLVQGEFLPKARLLVEDKSEGTELTIVYLNENGELTREYTEAVVVRAFCEGSAENTIIELWEDGSYRQVPAAVMGSYLEFTMEKPGTFRLTVVEEENNMIIFVIGAMAVLLFLLIVLIKIVRKHQKKKKQQVQAKAA